MVFGVDLWSQKECVRKKVPALHCDLAFIGVDVGLTGLLEYRQGPEERLYEAV